MFSPGGDPTGPDPLRSTRMRTLHVLIDHPLFVGVVVACVVALVLGVVFSAVFFAAAIAIGVVAWGYLAWTTRALRRDLRARSETPVDGAAPGEPARGRVYEGEGVAVRDEPR